MGHVSDDAERPGARVLWCLRRHAADVRCVVLLEATPVEVQVLQDHELVLTERFPGDRAALEWAHAYETRLREHGWHDSPAPG
jgi:hypothetical protein